MCFGCFNCRFDFILSKWTGALWLRVQLDFLVRWLRLRKVFRHNKMQRVPGWEAIPSEQWMETKELCLYLAHKGWDLKIYVKFTSKSKWSNLVITSSVCRRPILSDMWWLILQYDHQHHQHPTGSRGYGGHGLQETWAQEVQSPHHWQHRLLCHR